MTWFKDIKWVPNDDYLEVAVTACEAGKELLSRLEWMSITPKIILDASLHSGLTSPVLRQRYPDAQFLSLNNEEVDDHANSIDLIFANFMLPWQHDIYSVLRSWHHLLSPNGLLLFTALGPDTLKEFNQPSLDTPQLIEMHHLGDVLLQEQFVDPVIEVDHYTLNYQSKEKLLQEQRAAGMIMGEINNDAIILSDDNKYHATHEVIYAHAWKPEKKKQITEDNVTRIPLKDLFSK